MTISVAHNRAAELESLTRAFFIDAGTVTINGLSYQVSEVTSVSYSGNGTCAFSIVARPFETHTWMFGSVRRRATAITRRSAAPSRGTTTTASPRPTR